MSAPSARARVLIVPGLHDSGPAHWQSWLQAREPDALRVVQDDWQRPALDAWAERVGDTLGAADGPVLAVAHSFGCLALVRHLQQRPDSPVVAALLVAPADPARFGLDDLLDRGRLPLHATWVASTDDPWMSFGSSLRWAEAWGCRWVSLGPAGHINVQAGYGPLPLAAAWVRAARQRLHRARRAAQDELLEGSFTA